MPARRQLDLAGRRGREPAADLPAAVEQERDASVGQARDLAALDGAASPDDAARACRARPRASRGLRVRDRRDAGGASAFLRTSTPFGTQAARQSRSASRRAVVRQSEPADESAGSMTAGSSAARTAAARQTSSDVGGSSGRRPSASRRSSHCTSKAASPNSRVPDERAEERQRRLHTRDLVVVEGPREPRDRRGTILGVHDELARASGRSRSGRRSPPRRRRRCARRGPAAAAGARIRPGRGREVPPGILGVDAALDGVAAGPRALGERTAAARRGRSGSSRPRGRRPRPPRSPGARPGAACSSRGSRRSRRARAGTRRCRRTS